MPKKDDDDDASLLDGLRRGATRAWHRASEAAQDSVASLDGALNRALDRAVSARFDVPDADAAYASLESKTTDTSIISEALLARIVGGLITKFAFLRRIPWLAGRSNAWLAGAVVAANRTRVAVARGLREVQVIASYVASRAQRDGAEIDDRYLRAVTLAVYIDPRKRVDFRYRGRRGAAALARKWALGVWRTGPTSRDAVREWLRVVDSLDLTTLRKEWDASTEDPHP
jgi:hypothetical protein